MYMLLLNLLQACFAWRRCIRTFSPFIVISSLCSEVRAKFFLLGRGKSISHIFCPPMQSSTGNKAKFVHILASERNEIPVIALRTNKVALRAHPRSRDMWLLISWLIITRHEISSEFIREWVRKIFKLFLQTRNSFYTLSLRIIPLLVSQGT